MQVLALGDRWFGDVARNTLTFDPLAVDLLPTDVSLVDPRVCTGAAVWQCMDGLYRGCVVDMEYTIVQARITRWGKPEVTERPWWWVTDLADYARTL